MVMSPLGGGKVTQHPNQQARAYKSTILRFNEDLVRENVVFHPSAYLFNLYRREPEPLEDARYSKLLSVIPPMIEENAAMITKLPKKTGAAS